MGGKLSRLRRRKGPSTPSPHASAGSDDAEVFDVERFAEETSVFSRAVKKQKKRLDKQTTATKRAWAANRALASLEVTSPNGKSGAAAAVQAAATTTSPAFRGASHPTRLMSTDSTRSGTIASPDGGRPFKARTHDAIASPSGHGALMSPNERKEDIMIRAAVAWRSRWAEQNKQRERSHRRRLREQKKMQRDFSNAVGERDDERWRAARGDGREGRRRERRPSARDSLALYREDDVASPPPPPPPRSSKSKSKSPEPEREDANDDDDARRAPGGGRVLGPSRGGLRAGYEQVKVFRDGNSLFHCARLAEIVCQAREKEAAAGASNGSSTTRDADSVAAVLRRGMRSLGKSQANETATHLRRGAAVKIAGVEEDEERAREAASPPPSGGASRPAAGVLADDVSPRALDAAIVAAIKGSRLLRSRALPSGAPLDNWRRAMRRVADASEDPSLRDSDAYLRAMRVRDAFADAAARPNVPSSFVDVAALSAYLRRPITLIRGPVGVGEDDDDGSGSDDDGSDGDGGGGGGGGGSGGDNQKAARRRKRWRARCATEVVGAAHAARGRAGFTLFWELGEGVPHGLPAGDFILLVPRGKEEHERRRARADAAAFTRDVSSLPGVSPVALGTPTSRGGGGSGGGEHARGSGGSPGGWSPKTWDGMGSPVSSGAARATAGEERDEPRAPPPPSPPGAAAARRRARARAPAPAPAPASAIKGMLNAASDGHKHAVRAHARRGVSLAEADERGDTALHRAAAGGSVGLVKVVLKHANAPGQPSLRGLLEVTNADGETPLAVAVRHRRVKAATYLRNAGASDPRGLVSTLSLAPGYGTDGGYSSSSSIGSFGGGESSDSSALSDSDGGGSELSFASASESDGDGGGGRRRRARRADVDAANAAWAVAARPSAAAAGGGVASSSRASSVTSGAYGEDYRSEDDGYDSRGGWSDMTPTSGSERGDASETDGSLWNSESESSAGGSDWDASDYDDDDDARGGGGGDEGHGERFAAYARRY